MSLPLSGERGGFLHLSHNLDIIDMTGAQLAKIIGKEIELKDSRTGLFYKADIVDAVSNYGKIRIKVLQNGPWFEPTQKELDMFFSSLTEACV